jgi:hypothetical protein
MKMNITKKMMNGIKLLRMYIAFSIVLLFLSIISCSPPPTEQEIRDNIEGKWLFDGVIPLKSIDEIKNHAVIVIMEFHNSRFDIGLWEEIEEEIDSISGVEKISKEINKAIGNILAKLGTKEKDRFSLDSIRSDRTNKICKKTYGEETNYSISKNYINPFPQGYQVGQLEILEINDKILVAKFDGGKARRFINLKYYNILSEDEQKAIWKSKEDI